MPGDVSRVTLAVVPAFVPAADLSRAFYAEVVRPFLRGRPHAAALLGWGSDVLGYDTERSSDHGWGPRLVVFVEDDPTELAARLSAELPDSFRGWPVRYGWDAVPVAHHVTVDRLRSWLLGFLGADARAGMGRLDWLLTPQQRLLGVVAGPVYADDTGELAAVRRTLVWYPDQIWRWLVGCQWHRLAQEEAFVARTAEVGDASGSAVVAARLVRDLMRLALLLDRRYAPYQKWLGTAFAYSRQPDDLRVHLASALGATEIGPRQDALGQAYRSVAARHNAAGLTAPVDTTLREYHSRPARVLMADRFADACFATVTDPALRGLPPVGAIDQVVDSTDVLESPALYRRLAGLYA